MFFLIQTGQNRPSILEANKDEAYHLKMARYCVGQSNHTLQERWIAKIKINKRFYKGDQWIDEEDLEAFFKDDTNQDRNRLKVVQNQIRPIVEQFRGNAIRMNINYRVKSISPQAINRREKSLAKVLFMSSIANKPGNPYAADMKRTMPIGDNEADTRQTFDNLYTDQYVKTMNNLVRYVSERNSFEEKQLRVAEELVFSGLGVMKSFEYSGHQQFKVTPSDTFFFDRSAKEYDLSDCFYQGEVTEMTTSEIFEHWPDIDDTVRKSLEEHSRRYTQLLNNNTDTALNHIASGKIPVYTVYWKDGQTDEYGYVLDQYGYEYLTKINYVWPGEDKPRYTDKDLIQSKSERAQKLLRGKLKRKLYYDVLRMAIIIPREILASSSAQMNNSEHSKDVILDWGLSPYQECENIEYNTVKFPYKCYCWSYVDGEILSPIDDVINPQRFINRMASIMENQINNSRGSGTILDKSMVKDESEALRNMNQSKPVLVDAKGRGIQNAVGSYDGTVKQGTLVIQNIIDAMKNNIQQTNGINDAIKGESTGSDQLVGVTQLMIQRGSLMQEPFYNAVTLVYKQCYQSICTQGKRIYADNERNITIAVGDEGFETIRITKDMNSEDFRTFVKRENPDEQLISEGNQELLQFQQLQMLDNGRIANLWGRSSPDEVASALRAYAKEQIEVKKMAQKKQEGEQAQLQAQANQEQEVNKNQMFEDQARADVTDLHNKQFELKKEFTKALGKMAPHSEQAKNMLLDGAKSLQV